MTQLRVELGFVDQKHVPLIEYLVFVHVSNMHRLLLVVVFVHHFLLVLLLVLGQRESCHFGRFRVELKHQLVVDLEILGALKAMGVYRLLNIHLLVL